MSEQPRSSEPSERPETLVERLEALSAKWRKEAARWRTDDETPYACEWADTQENCADELDAVLSSLASRAVPSTGEATYPKLNQAGRLAWEDGYAAGKRDAAAPAASSGAAPRELPADIKRVREVAHAFREGYRAGYADGDCGEVEDAESAWDRSASSSLLTQPAVPPERSTPAAGAQE